MWLKMRFSRLELQIGKDNLKLLAEKTVLIVGCGGVGGYVIEALARSAIGTLILVDYDRVESSNCNRQLVALSSNFGKLKVDCYKDRCKEINPDLNVITNSLQVTPDNFETIFEKKIDFVVDACDDLKVKYALAQYCLEKNIAFISSMGTGNRFDPSKLIITTLDKTCNDPLAKAFRKKFSNKSDLKKIKVCTSTELPLKTNNGIISSNAFVPGGAGLLIASYVIKTIIEFGG